MTLRDIIQVIYDSGEDDVDLQAGLAVAQVVTSFKDGIPADLERVAGWLIGWHDQHGDITRQKLEDSLGEVLDIDLPDEALREAISVMENTDA